MGCTNNSVYSSYINESVNLKIDYINDTLIDKIYSECTNVMRKIEEIRILYSLKWNRLCIKTGVVVLLKPSFESVLKAIMWKLSVELPDLKNNYSLDIHKPYLEILYSKGVSDEMLEIEDAFMFYIDYFWQKKILVTDCFHDISSLYSNLIKEGKNILNNSKYLEKEK